MKKSQPRCPSRPCRWQSPVDMSSQPTLKAGIPVSLSGQFQVQGKQALEGLLAWADDVNNSGGVVVDGPGDRRGVSVVSCDDNSTPGGARQAAERLITQDRVDLLFGPYSSVLAKAAAEVAESRQRVLWNQGGASDDIYQQGYQWVVGIMTPATRYLEGLLPLVRQADPDANTLGIVRAYPGAFPKAVSSAVHRMAKSLGFSVNYIREFPPSLSDFSSVLGEIQAFQPEVLIVVGRIFNDIQFARQLVRSPLGLNAVAVVAAPIQQFRDALDDEVDGFLGPSQWEAGCGYPVDFGPAAEEALRSLARRAQGQIDYPMAQAYAAGLVAQACIAKAGSLDNRALREAANDLDISTFYGRFKIEPETGRQVGRSTLIVQWQKGRKVVLWPPEQRQGQLVYPWRQG